MPVMRRDGAAVYRNERLPSGRWRQRQVSAGMDVAEQNRPYTAQEAAAFLALRRWLRRELPQSRDELLGITRLATALLPFEMRPAAPTFLPLPVARAGSYSVSSLNRAA